MDDLQGIPVGLDAETFHTLLHTITIVLLVFIARWVTRNPPQ